MDQSWVAHRRRRPQKRPDAGCTAVNDNLSTGRSGLADTLATLARWVLGALFLYMGLKKALHPEEFLKLLRQYDMVSAPFLLNSIAAALPWFEAFCGLLLLAGIAVRGTALMLVVMLVPFTLLVLKRALGIAAAQHLSFCLVKFDCGCGAGEVFICNKLVENCVLTLIAAWLIAGAGRKLSLRFNLFPTHPLSVRA
jgi:uncharacterized membrane protein YphA (DoxX/SURF4 family)